MSSYRLDGRDVTYDEYESVLQKIGVLVKAKNFLVFQGDIESVASKTPKELTKFFEHICGSDLLKAEYDDLLQQKAEAEEKTMVSMQKKKMLNDQRKEVKDQRDEAKEYEMKREELQEMKTEQVLWKVFVLKLSMEEHQDSIDRNRVELIDRQEKEVGAK